MAKQQGQGQAFRKNLHPPLSDRISPKNLALLANRSLGDHFLFFSFFFCVKSIFSSARMNKLKIVGKFFKKDHYLNPDLCLGSAEDIDKGLIIGISPPDSQNYITISIKLGKEIKFNGDRIAYRVNCDSFFRTPYTKNRPSKKQLYNLVLQGVDELNNYIDSLPINQFSHKKHIYPDFAFLENDLQKSIDLWNTHYNEPFKRSNSRVVFKDLPSIPNTKLFKGRVTKEQEILQKLQSGLEISNEDEIIIDELRDFYRELRDSLTKLNFNSLTHRERKELKEYIDTVFKFTPLVVSEENVGTIYRIVKNRNLKVERITNRNQLINPPLKIVKKLKIHNRANTDRSTVMYCSTDLKATFLEVRDISDCFTLGVWKPINVLKSYIIPYLTDTNGQYTSTSNNVTAYIEDLGNTSIHLKNILKSFYQCISNEFTKSITDTDSKYNYLVSGWFSEKFLHTNLELNGTTVFDFDCLIYPSVENGFKSSNLALKSDKVNTLNLVNVVEFPGLTKNMINTLSEEEILKMGRFAKKIDKDGSIVW